MTAIGVFSVKGSPGATTLALALAQHGHTQGAVLIEADAAGGDLALRYGIAQRPGLAQLAARARHTDARRDVLDGLVRTVRMDGAGPVDLLPAPVEPAAVEAALIALAADPQALSTAAKARPLVLDLGRLEANSTGLRLLASCDTAVLVVRGDAVSLGHAREAGWVRNLTGDCGFVLVDTGPYRATEAADVLAMPCLAAVPSSRRPLRGRRATKTARALLTRLGAPAGASMPTPELVEVKG